ncbi:MAG: hypothetical protein RLZZ172_45 [Bacteroidota bacterium]|jgi:hypothetical protein
MINSTLCLEVFRQCVSDFHQHNNVDAQADNPYAESSAAHLLYRKHYIDTVQWHLEDIVRDPHIDPVAGLALKRRIDKSNQDRTDLVEQIDDHFLTAFAGVVPLDKARVNTESPAWAIDRLSILVLKIWHMQEEVKRQDADAAHRDKCSQKLQVLLEQQQDLLTSIDELLADLASGQMRMKVYRQMKMYNDPALNPVLYKQTT